MPPVLTPQGYKWFGGGSVTSRLGILVKERETWRRPMAGEFDRRDTIALGQLVGTPRCLCGRGVSARPNPWNHSGRGGPPR
jgi:hypothetical protein